MNTTLLPWPADAVMVVAARAGAELRHQMEGVHPGRCRRCGCRVHADTLTTRRADTHPARRGRPVLFFCPECSALYDAASCRVLERHNTAAGRNAALSAMLADALDWSDPL